MATTSDSAKGSSAAIAAAASDTEAQRLADFALRFTLADAPAAVVAKAKAHMLVAFGLALAATGFDFAREILAGAKALGMKRPRAGDRPSPADARVLSHG